jgi:metallo-beta-lactamase class B
MLLAATAPAQDAPGVKPDKAIRCDACDGWNRPHEPFRVFGNTYYVGVAGLSAVLIASNDGLILLDGGLPQSAPFVDRNIRALGFRTEMVRMIVNSHAHFDHAGGIAALQRASGAAVAASKAGAQALERGEPVPDDPQYGFGRKSTAFPPVARVRVVADGETLRVGDLALTAHLTPGHTPGSTTWTWRSCEGARCLDLVYADSLNAVSSPEFRFTDHPGLVEGFRRSIDKVKSLPCDILLSVHPEFSNLDKKLQLREQGARPDPFIDANSCNAYAQAASRSLERRIAQER